MSIIDVIRITIYVLIGVLFSSVMGKNFGPGYGLLGFPIGLVVGWLIVRGGELLIFRLPFGKSKGSKSGDHDKKPTN